MPFDKKTALLLFTFTGSGSLIGVAACVASTTLLVAVPAAIGMSAVTSVMSTYLIMRK